MLSYMYVCRCMYVFIILMKVNSNLFTLLQFQWCILIASYIYHVSISSSQIFKLHMHAITHQHWEKHAMFIFMQAFHSKEVVLCCPFSKLFMKESCCTKSCTWMHKAFLSEVMYIATEFYNVIIMTFCWRSIINS